MAAKFHVNGNGDVHVNGNGNGHSRNGHSRNGHSRNGNPIKRYWIDGKLRKLPPLHAAERRVVDVRRDPRDFMVCLLAATGFSNACIQKVVPGVSDGQIYYRLRKGNVNRWAARNGDTVIARKMLDKIVTTVAPVMQKQLPNKEAGT